MPRSGRCWTRSWSSSAPGTSGSRTATSARPNFLFGIAGREASFVVRQHASTLHWEFAGKRRACGRIDTGKVFEQTIRATNDAGEVLILRRITVVLDKPTRDGDAEIHLLTNVPAKDARAKVIAELYRRRWTIETAFAELEATLNGEVNTLGYPKAALFAFCVALVAYNVLSTLKAALRSVHGEEVVAEDVSGYYVADEIKMTHRGMMIAIPEDEWVVFHDLAPAELAGGVGAVGGGGSPAEVPQASPRPEEAEAREAERSQDQACGHGEDLGRSSKVYEMTSLGGWVDLA